MGKMMDENDSYLKPGMKDEMEAMGKKPSKGSKSPRKTAIETFLGGLKRTPDKGIKTGGVVKKDAFGASGGWEGMTNMSMAQKIAEMRKAGVDEATIKDMLKAGKGK